jgi:hypothetical protein
VAEGSRTAFVICMHHVPCDSIEHVASEHARSRLQRCSGCKPCAPTLRSRISPTPQPPRRPRWQHQRLQYHGTYGVSGMQPKRHRSNDFAARKIISLIIALLPEWLETTRRFAAWHTDHVHCRPLACPVIRPPIRSARLTCPLNKG